MSLSHAGSAGLRGTWAGTEDILAVLPVIVWEADGVDHRMLFVSSRARDILGHDPEAWVAEAGFWGRHVHPDDREVASMDANAAIDAVTPAELVYRFRAADGTYRWFRDAISVVTQPDGGRRLAGVMLDITDQVSAEAQRDLLATAVEQASDAVVITSVDATIQYVNPAFERATGYTREEVIGANPRLLQSGRQAEAFYDEMWAALTAGRPWTGEFANRRKDGSLYVEEASISPVHDPDGAIRHYVAVKRDVTRERAEREARERLAAIVDAAADAAYAYDLDGGYVAWNESAERIYGWRRDEVIGRTVYELADPAHHARITDWIRRVGEGATIGPVDITHRARDGRSLTVSVVVAPIRDDAGLVRGVATIARDVSAERRAATERLALEARLRQVQKMDAIGRLAGGIAHDFNNLLTAIHGFATLVADELDGAALEDQQRVIAATEHAADLTRRLLSFARALPSVRRPVDLDAVLRESAKLVGRLIPERIVIDLQAEAGCFVVMDQLEVEQLLFNLVVNAADAMPGPGRITVRTARMDDATVALTVRDTGGGMDAATQARVFDPFFTTKDQGRGIGLGLSIVYGIVEEAGGSVSVRSAENMGTTFTLRLPIHEGPVETAPPKDPGTVTGSAHVMLVEDAVAVRELAERYLVEAGYRVTAVADPSEVLGRDLSDVDLIVTDVIMPGMSGPEMIRQIQASIPVVFISGYTGSELADEPLVGRRYRLLEKPFTGHDLCVAVRDALNVAGIAPAS